MLNKKTLVLAFAMMASLSSLASAAGKVALLRVPDGGLQPQVAVDGQGGVHLIYFSGKAEAGDIFYAKWDPAKAAFTAPKRVNSQPGSAMAVGTIRGGQLAVGKGGRVHVVWNGSDKAQPRGPSNPEMNPPDKPNNGTPFLYARLNDTGYEFELQRNLVQATWALDGGGAVAADGAGNVYAFWGASDNFGKGKGEAGRRIWLAVSRDDGKTFFKERHVNPDTTGACGCCGMKAMSDQAGHLAVLYRAAGKNVDRDEYALISKNKGKSFKAARLDQWKIEACPMSSASLAGGADGMAAAWENNGQVFLSFLEGTAPPVAAPGTGTDRKHPVVAVNAQGETLMAWVEGSGWQKGGSLAWQVFDKAGHPTADAGHADGVPAWSLPAAYATPDGGFTVIY